MRCCRNGPPTVFQAGRCNENAVGRLALAPSADMQDQNAWTTSIKKKRQHTMARCQLCQLAQMSPTCWPGASARSEARGWLGGNSPPSRRLPAHPPNLQVSQLARPITFVFPRGAGAPLISASRAGSSSWQGHVQALNPHAAHLPCKISTTVHSCVWVWEVITRVAASCSCDSGPTHRH